MTTNDETLDPVQSMELIQDMIGKARNSFSQVSFYFLLWGVLLFLAGITQYVLMQIGFKLFWIGWPTVGIIGGIIASVHGAREGKKHGAMGYADRIIAFIWGGFTVTLILTIVGIVGTDVFASPTPFILLLTGLPTFITGGILKFNPLMVGGLIFWLSGILTFFFLPEFDSLIFSVAILFGYVVPGIMLKRVEA